ncbi:MAG: hypothetical protein JO337_09525 [Acidimicrobiales bacterium]|nr:hypothetical protein [Acidimicrobiales bacterium]
MEHSREGEMTEEELFACIASELARDRAWLRHMRWIGFAGRARALCIKALCCSAPAGTTWMLV